MRRGNWRNALTGNRGNRANAWQGWGQRGRKQDAVRVWPEARLLAWASCWGAPGPARSLKTLAPAPPGRPVRPWLRCLCEPWPPLLFRSLRPTAPSPSVLAAPPQRKWSSPRSGSRDTHIQRQSPTCACRLDFRNRREVERPTGSLSYVRLT